MTSVFIIVFDGLQPSQITPELMPNLARFASEGVVFERHHPVFPTVTRINAASMVTGCNPGRHGLAANLVVMRDLDPASTFPVLEPNLRQLGSVTNGRVLQVPPIAEIFRAHDMSYAAVGVGTSGNAYVHNAHPDVSNGLTVHPDFCLPDIRHNEILDRFGEWPDESLPNVARVEHAGKIVTDHVLVDLEPDVTLFWCSEPDKSQHAAGVSSPLAVSALAAADAEFGRVLRVLEKTGKLDSTDVLVVSDHGYSTITEAIPVKAMLGEAGFGAPGADRGVVVAENGGSVLFYTHPFSRETSDSLAEWLMSQSWCGALVASEAVGDIEGTLPLSLTGGEGERAPDLVMSFAWNSEPNESGVPGHAYSASGKAGTGQHGSMSKHDLRNTLVARGPSFRSGLQSTVPSGNLDIAPTVMHLLGLDETDHMDGRVLHEALRGSNVDVPQIATDRHSAERVIDGHRYQQNIQTVTVVGTTYLDEGNAEHG